MKQQVSGCMEYTLPLELTMGHSAGLPTLKTQKDSLQVA
jgi:hypothetical protein